MSEIDHYILKDGVWGWINSDGSFFWLSSPRMGADLQTLMNHAYQLGINSVSAPAPGDLREKLISEILRQHNLLKPSYTTKEVYEFADQILALLSGKSIAERGK